MGWEAGKLQHKISEAPGYHLTPETCVVETRGVGILLIRAPRNFGSAPSSIQSSMEACERRSILGSNAGRNWTYVYHRVSWSRLLEEQRQALAGNALLP